MKQSFSAALLAVLVFASCATDKVEPDRQVDQRSISIHLQDLVYDSSVFGSALANIRAGRLDAAINRLELAQDATIIKLDELIPYVDAATQKKVVRELQSIKAARKIQPRRTFVVSGQPYDEEIAKIVNGAQAVLNRVE